MVKIAVIYGSVRSERVGIKGARFIEKKLQERGCDVVFVDPKEYPLPLLDKMYKEYNGDAPEAMQQLHEIFSSVDGYVIVSGEYNHSVPAALKNILDHFQAEYNFKPSAIAPYSVGAFGGVRVAMHLRAVLGELGMSSIPSIFPMAKVHQSFDDAGNAVDTYYEERVKRFIDEFLWYVDALKKKREEGVPY